jgi:CubicO group peptidase (beta-lactamase class C family)
MSIPPPSRPLPRLLAVLLPVLFFLLPKPLPARESAMSPPGCWMAGGSSIPAGLPPDLTAALNSITPMAERARAVSNVPAITVAVMLDGAVVYAGSFGCASIGADAPALPGTILRAGSISKLFTATMLMQLRDAGLLEIDRPVRDYVPEVWYRAPDGRENSPTFRQLASHTAGLPRTLRPPPSSPEELFRRLHEVRAIADPGRRVSYSNLGVAVLGQALAKIAGEPYDRYVADHILAPLGMESSSFDPSTLPSSRLATGYTAVELGADGAILARSAPPSSRASMAPAGGLYTTALDLLRFAALQWGGTPSANSVLAAQSVREMQRPIASAGGPASAGIGWFIRDLAGQTMLMHNGSVDGFRADLRVVPSSRLAVAVLYNQRLPRGSAFVGPERLSMQILTALLPLLATGARQN